MFKKLRKKNVNLMKKYKLKRGEVYEEDIFDEVCNKEGIPIIFGYYSKLLNDGVGSGTDILESVIKLINCKIEDCEKILAEKNLKECCKECGFPVDIERKPIFITKNIASYNMYEILKCKSCGHQKTGSTIPAVYEHIRQIKKIWERKQAEKVEEVIKNIKDLENYDEHQIKIKDKKGRPFVRVGNVILEIMELLGKSEAKQ